MRNYEYKSPNSRFGIKTLLLAPASPNSNGFRQWNGYINIANNQDQNQLGYFQWTASALASSFKKAPQNNVTETSIAGTTITNANYKSDISFGLGKSILTKSQGAYLFR